MINLIVWPIENEHRNGEQPRLRDRPDLDFVRNVNVEELGGLGRPLEQFSSRDFAFLFVASRKVEGRVERVVGAVAQLEHGAAGCGFESEEFSFEAVDSRRDVQPRSGSLAVAPDVVHVCDVFLLDESHFRKFVFRS